MRNVKLHRIFHFKIQNRSHFRWNRKRLESEKHAKTPLFMYHLLLPNIILVCLMLQNLWIMIRWLQVSIKFKGLSWRIGFWVSTEISEKDLNLSLRMSLLPKNIRRSNTNFDTRLNLIFIWQECHCHFKHFLSVNIPNPTKDNSFEIEAIIIRIISLFRIVYVLVLNYIFTNQ